MHGHSQGEGQIMIRGRFMLRISVKSAQDEGQD